MRSDLLGRIRQEAIAALLTHRNVEEAARAAGIGTQTLYRWMKEPESDYPDRQAKRVAFGQALARLQQSSSAAATMMLKIMIDTGAPASTRLRAADCVFGHANNAIEMEQIEGRIAALEQQQAAELKRGTNRGRLMQNGRPSRLERLGYRETGPNLLKPCQGRRS
jgi:transposase-like protein